MKKSALILAMILLPSLLFAETSGISKRIGIAYAFKNAELDPTFKINNETYYTNGNFFTSAGLGIAKENSVFYFKPEYNFFQKQIKNHTDYLGANILTSVNYLYDYSVEWDIYANLYFSQTFKIFYYRLEGGIGNKTSFIFGINSPISDFNLDYCLTFGAKLPWNAKIETVFSSYDLYRYPLFLCPQCSISYSQKISPLTTFITEVDVSSSDKFTTAQYVDFIEAKFYLRFDW